LAVFVDQAYQRDRHVENAFGQARQAAEALFRIGVQDFDGAQRSQALRLVYRRIGRFNCRDSRGCGQFLPYRLSG
jgi:hypothetical protein